MNLEGQGHSETIQMARNMAQMELIETSKKDPLVWINDYAKDFDKIVSSNPDILARLAESTTHIETLEEVRKKLYH